jgi:hypothetical protein
MEQQLKIAEMTASNELLKAQISKIENSIKNARFETILRAFEALEARVYFQVEF